MKIKLTFISIICLFFLSEHVFSKNEIEVNDKELIHNTEFIALSGGVKGGIASFPPDLEILILPGGPQQKYEVWLMRSPEVGKEMYFKGHIEKENFISLLTKIIKLGLWDLPIESPPASEDIYGFRTEIHVHAKNRCWINQVPRGCRIGISTVHPDENQVKNFREIITLIRLEAEKFATTPCEKWSFQNVFGYFLSTHFKCRSR